MKWKETVASYCRYGDVAERIWSDWEILWEDSVDDYQGHATILAKKENKYSFYEWWYGSCSGCDGWEADGKDDEAIEKEMRETALWLDSKKELKKWLDMLDGDPRSNASMERGGALAYGLDFLIGGTRSRINSIRSELGMPLLSEPKSE
jgi:hypothetical protein